MTTKAPAYDLPVATKFVAGGDIGPLPVLFGLIFDLGKLKAKGRV